MKISELIKKIVKLANVKFQVDHDHLNDFIEVSIAYDTDWQVSLLRPTASQLSINANHYSPCKGYPIGRVIYDNSSISSYKYESHLYSRGETLKEALNLLYSRLEKTEMETKEFKSRLTPINSFF